MKTTNENTTIDKSSSKFNWEKAKKQIVNLEETLKRSLRSQSGKYAIFRFSSYDCMWEGEGYYEREVRRIYAFKDRQVCPYGCFGLIVEDSDSVE